MPFWNVPPFSPVPSLSNANSYAYLISLILAPTLFASFHDLGPAACIRFQRLRQKNILSWTASPNNSSGNKPGLKRLQALEK